MEELREELYKTIEECKGNLLDPRVLSKSQELDMLLNREGGSNGE